MKFAAITVRLDGKHCYVFPTIATISTLIDTLTVGLNKCDHKSVGESHSIAH